MNKTGQGRQGTLGEGRAGGKRDPPWSGEGRVNRGPWKKAGTRGHVIHGIHHGGYKAEGTGNTP